MNALLNTFFADQKLSTKWLPWTEGKLQGTTMQPQSCRVWRGMTVTGCTRGSGGREGPVTNGVFYVIQDFDDATVSLQMHPDYAKNYVAKVERSFPQLQSTLPGLVTFLQEKPRTEKDLASYPGMQEKLDKGLTALSALKALGFVAIDGVMVVPEQFKPCGNDPDVEPSLPNEIMGPEAFTMSWGDFQKCLRLTHALPYVYYQGKTVADQTLWLMNVKSKHFTMRHLILGLGRVQRAENVKICGPGREKMVLERAQEAFENYEKRARSEATAAVAPKVDEDGDLVMESDTVSVPDPFSDVGFDRDGDDEEPVDFEDPFADETFEDDI